MQSGVVEEIYTRAYVLGSARIRENRTPESSPLLSHGPTSLSDAASGKFNMQCST